MKRLFINLTSFLKGEEELGYEGASLPYFSTIFCIMFSLIVE